ncbi:MAG TPA: protease pro-enzyme activation domain-containing protein, partial [bacterium]|nr:protease pro-enzyme activation domain-containing protein [bacterium]
MAGLALACAMSLPASQTLHGCLRPEFSAAPRIGDLAPATSLPLALGLPLPDPAGLDAFIATLYDPRSPNYRRFLSPQDFAERFGPSRTDYQALIDFARAQGLTVYATHTSRLLLQVRGRADRIERVFHVSLGRHRRADGTEFFAPDNEPSVDLDLPGLSVSGLDNYSRWHSRARRHPRTTSQRPLKSARTRPLGGTAQGSAYQGDDFRDAYVPGVSLQGTGQSIGLVEFGGFYSQDITTYETSSKPPLATNSSITTVSTDDYDGNPLDNGDDENGGPEGDCAEVSLDIELALSMAPKATIVVYEAYDWDAMSVVLAAIADNPVCAQISCSWGGGTLSEMGSNAADYLAELSAQGQGFFNASGDQGAYSSENTDPVAAGPVGYPDSLSQYITEVGGTNLTTNGPS